MCVRGIASGHGPAGGEVMDDWTESTELCVSCPACAFSFNSHHVDVEGGGYSCPACSELELNASLAASRALVEEKNAALAAGLKAVPLAQPTRRGVSVTGQKVNEWRTNARAALVLTEADMLKRLEVK